MEALCVAPELVWCGASQRWRREPTGRHAGDRREANGLRKTFCPESLAFGWNTTERTRQGRLWRFYRRAQRINQLFCFTFFGSWERLVFLSGFLRDRPTGSIVERVYAACGLRFWPEGSCRPSPNTPSSNQTELVSNVCATFVQQNNLFVPLSF